MIAPADFPPHPTKGKILFDGYHNTLIWENSHARLTAEEVADAAYRKSIAGYAAPWNPAVGQKWLDLKTNRVMVHRGFAHWCYEDQPIGSSAIPVETYTYWSTQSQPPPHPTGAEIEKQTKTKPKPLPQEPEPPKKSRVFTLK